MVKGRVFSIPTYKIITITRAAKHKKVALLCGICFVSEMSSDDWHSKTLFLQVNVSMVSSYRHSSSIFFLTAPHIAIH